MAEKEEYNIRTLKKTIFKFLANYYPTQKGEKIRGDEAIISQLFEIIIKGDNKEKIQAITLYKELLNLLEKTHLL